MASRKNSSATVMSQPKAESMSGNSTSDEPKPVSRDHLAELTTAFHGHAELFTPTQRCRR
jgi:hypothetical protein